MAGNSGPGQSQVRSLSIFFHRTGPVQKYTTRLVNQNCTCRGSLQQFTPGTVFIDDKSCMQSFQNALYNKKVPHSFIILLNMHTISCSS